MDLKNKKLLLDEIDENDCFLVKVLDKNTNESVFNFNEGYYRTLEVYPPELINLFVDYILEELELEIFFFNDFLSSSRHNYYLQIFILYLDNNTK